MIRETASPEIGLRFADSELTVYPVLELPAYEFEGSKLRINDVVWGACEIGDQPYDEMLVRLARTSLFRRLQAVEQLTLPSDLSVLPNTSSFSRWQHIWGSLVFVRKIMENDDRFSPRDCIVSELRTLLSDAGQTAFSHLGDWISQGVNGGDNLHDIELMELLRQNEVGEIVESYGITLEEVVFPDVGPDWVECPSPDICVDRVDYGMREILRWVQPSIDFSEYRHKLTNPKELFVINDNMMLEVKADELGFGRKLAVAFNILNSEDWGHPIQRMQTDLLQVAVKRALLDGHFSDGIVLDDPGVNPRDRLYGVDSDFRFAFYDPIGAQLHRLMVRIGFDQRQAFVHGRRYDFDKVFRGTNAGDGWEFPEFPIPLQSYSCQSGCFGLTPLSVELERLSGDNDFEPALTAATAGLMMTIPRKKRRFVDPSIGGRQLSGIDPGFGKYLDGQKSAIEQSYKANILVDRRFAARIIEIVNRVDELWPSAIELPRSQANLSQIIEQAGLYGGGNRFDDIIEL